ncbi:MAG: hypothetical protein ABEI53_03145, partial [Candidatus Magasanikbacteria bacterium]
ALAIMFQYREYGSKKMVVRLIGAAILVNFSLAIGFVFINFSNTVTKFFLSSSTTGIGSGELGKTISGALDAQQLVLDSGSTEGSKPPTPPSPGEGQSGLSLFATKTLAAIVSFIFTAAFFFIATLTMLAFALMLLIRYVALSLLLIISPIAWLLWVIPDMSGKFKEWWSRFLKWTFFAPAVSFFMYIALIFAKELDQVSGGSIGVGAGFSADLNRIVQTGSNMFITVGMMLGGIYVANQMGIKGAQGAMSIAKSAKGTVQGYAKGAAGGAAGAAAGAAGTGVRKTYDKLMASRRDDKGRPWLQRKAENYSGMPIVGKAFSGVAGASANAKERLEEDYEDYKDQYEDMSGKRNAQALNRKFTQMNDERIAALASNAIEKGSWDDLDQETQKKAMNSLDKIGKLDELIKVRPDLALGEEIDDNISNLSQDIREEIEKAMNKLNPNDAPDIDSSSLDNQAVTLNLSNSHLGKIGSENPNLAKEVWEQVKDMYDKNTDPQSQFKIPQEEQDKLDRIIDYFDENSNYKSI